MVPLPAVGPSRSPRALLNVVKRGLDLLPPTPSGLLLSVAGALAVFAYGSERQDLILYVAGYGVMGLCVLSAALVSLCALGLRLSFRPATPREERLDAGVAVETGFSLAGLRWLPLISTRWEWLDPQRVAVSVVERRGRQHEVVVHGERGEHQRTVRQLVVEDVLGLARVRLRLCEPAMRTVLPARGRPPTAPLMRALIGGDHFSHPAPPPDGDRIEMRRYTPGDPIKLVLWKAYARNRTLMVRVPERAVSPARRTFGFLVAGEGDEPPAGLARLALESGALGAEWWFGAAGSDECARDLDAALRLIVRSRSARERGAEGLAAFAGRARSLGGRLVLFAPARRGPWLPTAVAQLRALGVPVEVLLGCDAIADRPRRGGWLLARPQERPDEARLSELEAIAAELAAVGATVTAIERPSGKVHRNFSPRAYGGSATGGRYGGG